LPPEGPALQRNSLIALVICKVEKVLGLFSVFPAFQLGEDRQMIYWAFPSLPFTIGSQPGKKKKVQILKRCVSVLSGLGENSSVPLK
jgi:hypothetical protein